jgi:hypothetical protein
MTFVHLFAAVLASWPSKQANIQDADWSETGSMVFFGILPHLTHLSAARNDIVG